MRKKRSSFMDLKLIKKELMSPDITVITGSRYDQSYLGSVLKKANNPSLFLNCLVIPPPQHRRKI